MPAPDPFAPPRSEPPPQAPVPGSPLRAVLTGLAIDIGGSLLMGLLLTAAWSASLASDGLGPAEIRAALQSLSPDAAVVRIGELLGAGLSTLGGYVCARIARQAEYRLAAIQAGVSAVFGLLMAGADDPPAQTALLALCTVACVMLGAHLGKLRPAGT